MLAITLPGLYLGFSLGQCDWFGGWVDEPTVSMQVQSGQPVLAASLLSGNWGPFTLREKVGQGGFGEVYRAFDTTLQREVALKLLLPHGQDEDAEARALLREARAIAKVRHPNVVPIYGVDRHEGRVGFWSDFVNGKTLSAIVAADGPFGAREAALIGVDLCKAVGAVHAAGLLHRDIKSGNAMRESGGRILLMDFGLTEASDAAHHHSGTPVYMAPELIAGEPASVSSDIYALGILLFHLLTGKYPVDGNTFDAIRVAHEAGARQTLLDIRPDLPQPLAHVVETAAHADPAKRYKTAGQMISALTDAAGLGPVTLENLGQIPAKSASWRKPAWGIAGVLVAVLAIVSESPQVRSLVLPNKTIPLAAVQDDYQKARDLLDHYYRPQALETAIPLLEKIVAKDPKFAPGFADLGRANVMQLIQQRDTKYIEPARQASLQALSLKPDLASAHVTMGILYLQTAKNDLAAQELDEAVKLDQYNAAAYAALGDLYYRQGRRDQAEPALQKAGNVAPDDWGILQQLGDYYLDTGKVDKAAEQYQKAADLVPDNARAQNNLGIVYRMKNRFSEAKSAFQKACALEPTFTHYRNLGRVLLEEGNYSEAEKMFNESIRLRPDHYRAWGFLANVYQGRGVEKGKVAATYQKAISLTDELRKQTPSAYILADVGAYYAALGNERQSVPLLRQAATLAPDKPEVLYEVATGYERLHKRDEALVWLDHAMTLGISPQFLERIPELSALRADARYRAIVNKLR